MEQEELPPFYFLYPNHYPYVGDNYLELEKDSIVSPPKRRKSFFINTIGDDIVIFSLDTGN